MNKLNAIECPKCKDLIYSTAIHDFHKCSCKSCFIDGGFGEGSYLRYGWENDINRDDITHWTLELDVSKKELYDDWNFSLRKPRKYGIIKEQDRSKFKLTKEELK